MSIGLQVAQIGSLSCSVTFLTVPVMVVYLSFGFSSVSLSPLVIVRVSQAGGAFKKYDAGWSKPSALRNCHDRLLTGSLHRRRLP